MPSRISDEESVDTPDDQPPRWFQRVLPLTVVVLVVLALAAGLSSSVRHQIGLSATRQPDPYLELYFARPTSGAQAVCTRSGRTVRVSFVVESHLASRRSITYRVVVDPIRKGLRSHRDGGSTAVSPGRTFEVNTSMKLPAKAGYLVRVTLPGTDQALRARCQGAANA